MCKSIKIFINLKFIDNYPQEWSLYQRLKQIDAVCFIINIKNIYNLYIIFFCYIY